MATRDRRQATIDKALAPSQRPRRRRARRALSSASSAETARIEGFSAAELLRDVYGIDARRSDSQRQAAPAGDAAARSSRRASTRSTRRAPQRSSLSRRRRRAHPPVHLPLLAVCTLAVSVVGLAGFVACI